MNILTRYTLSSIIKIAIVTILIFAAILAAVELFSKMDQIMHGGVEIPSLIEYIILSLPEYLMMVASISFLFAVTYFLSTLTARLDLRTETCSVYSWTTGSWKAPLTTVSR